MSYAINTGFSLKRCYSQTGKKHTYEINCSKF